MWMAVPHCLMWCIWQERNNWCFEDYERTIGDLKLFFFKTLSDWMSIIGSHSNFSVYDLMDVCNLCIWLFWSPIAYTSCILGWLLFMTLNKIFFTCKIKWNKKKKKKNYGTLFNDVDPWLKHENNVHRIFITTIYMTFAVWIFLLLNCFFKQEPTLILISFAYLPLCPCQLYYSSAYCIIVAYAILNILFTISYCLM